MGISLYGLTPATTYDALIKTGDNEPLTSALKVLSDGVGTNLPMEASTTGINFTGTTTVSGVAVANATQLATKQDTLVSGTNIKTINGTSVLGAGNIVTPSTPPSGVAGAIQFSAGSAFASDATNLFWDDTNNRLGIGTNAPIRTLDVVGAGRFYQGFGVGIPTLFAFNGRSENDSTLRLENSGSGNMLFGGNGLLIDGNATFGQSNTTLGARVGIKGSGSTSATTSLLVQNSAGTQIMQMRDDGVTKFLGGAARIEATYIWMNSGQLDVPIIYNAGTMYLTPTGNVFGSASRIGSALLQVDSTTQGFLPPRMTTTQKNAIATPAAGLVVYDNTTNKLQCYNGSTWNDLF
jgi:hypothetical protein